MQHTEDQKTDFKRRFSAKRRSQIVLAIPLVAIVLLLALSEGRASPSRSTDTERVQIKTSAIRSALAGQICTSGYSRHARCSGPCLARRHNGG